jgi:hypothetical protein
MKVWLVIPYRVNHLQRYSVTIRGNVTSVDPHLEVSVRKVDRIGIKECLFLYRSMYF